MSGGFGLPVLDIAGALGKLGKNYQEGYQNAFQQAALGKLGDQLQGGDYAGAARTAFNAGDASVGLNLLKLGQAQEQQKAATAGIAGLTSMYGGGGFDTGGPVGAPGAPRQAPAGGVPSFLNTDGPSGGYLTGLFKRESNNDTMAQASGSSARGLGQFTKGTWNSVAQRYPDLGLTPVTPTTDGRTDPEQMVRATRAFTAENEGLLAKSGLPVNDATRYSMHIFGSGGGRRFVAGTLANPDTPAASLVQPEQVAANRPVFFNRDGSPKTAGQVMNDFARSFGGGGRSAPQAPRQVASADPGFMPTSPGPLTRSPMQAPVSGLNPARLVQVADDENQTQILESRMGMYPRDVYGATPPQTAAADPQADLPAPGAQNAQFVIPPGPQPTMPGAVASLPAGLSSPQPRGPLQPTMAPSSSPGALNFPRGTPAPTLPDASAAPARVMTMPGQDGASASPEARVQLSAQAPQHLAQAGLPPQVAAPIGQMAPGSSQRIGALMRVAMLPGLSEGQAGIVKALLTNELEQTKLPDDVKQYMFARSQGFTGSLVDYKNELRKPLTPTTVAPGSAVIFPGERTPAYIAPRADDTKLTNVPAGTTVFDPVTRQPVYTAPAADKGEDEASKIQAQIAARKKVALDLGLQEGTPAWRSFVAAGKVGADRDMSPTEKKAIQDADTQVLSAQSTIDALTEAKKLSSKAYGGPWAGKLATIVNSTVGSDAAQATQDLDNLLTTNALGQLKGTFGGNPTEGERAILLETQGSSGKPDALRQKIYDRGIRLAQLRLQQAQERAAQIREGTYFRSGGGPSAAGGSTPRQDASGGQSGAPALPPPSPSNRPGAVAPAARFQQLIGSGMSEDAAYARMHQEGY